MTPPQLSAERLKGKTAIITGGASGIGLASVHRFLAEGANVVCVDLDADRAAASVEGAGDRGTSVAADVTDKAAVQAVVDSAIERYGAIDCYFNNAGVPMVAAGVDETTDDAWDLNVAVNLTAFFYAARIVVPHMRERGGGTLLVTASISGVRPRPMLSAYTAAKAGAIGLAKQLAIELADTGIRVNAVCPVSTETPMLAGFGMGDHVTAKATPVGRLGRPEEMAAAAAWLASDDAAFITGTAFAVDGGRSI